MTNAWYSPADVRYTREQMIWLIEWMPFYDETTKWPPEPKDTGYTESPNVQSSRSHHAAFENPAMIYAEVTYRLDRTGEAGETLVWEVQNGLDSYELLAPQARRALNYISGWRRRRLSFRNWKASHNYYHTVVKGKRKDDSTHSI